MIKLTYFGITILYQDCAKGRKVYIQGQGVMSWEFKREIWSLCCWWWQWCIWGRAGLQRVWWYLRYFLILCKITSGHKLFDTVPIERGLACDCFCKQRLPLVTPGHVWTYLFRGLLAASALVSGHPQSPWWPWVSKRGAKVSPVLPLLLPRHQDISKAILELPDMFSNLEHHPASLLIPCAWIPDPGNCDA